MPSNEHFSTKKEQILSKTLYLMIFKNSQSVFWVQAVKNLKETLGERIVHSLKASI